ncbi:hypothetical protein GCM10020358_78630 [Amorphoplanes nipponensis]|uniref:Uncharacterized protein n=1 Tax=Actinoplanes nipponensis TaxID=135950 RepID=A0A919MX17_9ACTN|nr:hypothetical protein Ani05nite_63390 [Actinoplanes nipponensis]
MAGHAGEAVRPDRSGLGGRQAVWEVDAAMAGVWGGRSWPEAPGGGYAVWEVVAGRLAPGGPACGAGGCGGTARGPGGGLAVWQLVAEQITARAAGMQCGRSRPDRPNSGPPTCGETATGEAEGWTAETWRGRARPATPRPACREGSPPEETRTPPIDLRRKTARPDKPENHPPVQPP